MRVSEQFRFHRANLLNYLDLAQAKTGYNETRRCFVTISRSCDHEHPGVNTEARAFAGFSDKVNRSSSSLMIGSLRRMTLAFRLSTPSIVDFHRMSINP
jgi:hypothetical protein